MKWRIYYEDGEFSSEEGGIAEAPARGVMVIVQDDEHVGWATQTGSDYYVWRDGRWWGVDIFGLYDFLIELGLVKFGRTITSKEFNAIYQRALSEAPKHGFKPKERKP